MSPILIATVPYTYTTTSPAFSASFNIELYSTVHNGVTDYYGFIKWQSGSYTDVNVQAIWDAFVASNPSVPGFADNFSGIDAPARYYAGNPGGPSDVINGGNAGGGIYSAGGADVINATVRPGQTHGNDGNDEGNHTGGHAEWHVYMGRGNDTINMNFAGVQTSTGGLVAYSMGHHVQGDLQEPAGANAYRGNDVFNFTGLTATGANAVSAGEVVVGRFDDFDYSRDVIQIHGISLTNLNVPPSNLPAGVSFKIVHHVGSDPAMTETQQWLVISTSTGGHIVYGLEGDRVRMNYNVETGGRVTEPHFITHETALSIIATAGTTYIDPRNYVPAGEVIEAGGVFINDEDNSSGALTDIGAVNTPINGTEFGDRIAAGVNNDVVNANAGNDKVWGGGGSDTVNGGTGNDTVMGGFGNDALRGDAGNDSLLGEIGNDILTGGTGADLLFGGDGTDVLDGGTGADALFGGNGVDTATYASATAGVRADMTSSSTNTGDALGDTYSSIENLIGSNHADTLKGNASNNSLTGNTGNDVLAGEAGNDKLYGGVGNDELYGGSGLDALYGGDGFDLLMGDVGNDTLDGGTGNDTILGQEGADRLTGGLGDDLFRYQNAAQGGDTITDFSNATGNNDRFSINAAGFGGGLVSGSLAASQFVLRTTNTNAALDGNDRFIFNTVSNTLWFDVDGTGSQAAVLIATLQNGAPDVTAGDIWLL